MYISENKRTILPDSTQDIHPVIYRSHRLCRTKMKYSLIPVPAMWGTGKIKLCHKINELIAKVIS